MNQDNVQKRQVRGKDGRFQSATRRSPDLDVTGKGVGKYKQKRRRVMRILFEAYLKVFFLIGTAQDHVPFSSSSGPLVETYERIVKSSYLLGRRNRSEILQEIYKGDMLRGVQSQISRPTFKIAGSSSNTTRPKVYMFRRLPSMANYSHEIVPLKAWLRSLESAKSIACSYDEAYSICCKAIGSYQMMDDKRVYLGFPSCRPNGSSSVDGDGKNSSQENRDPNIMEICNAEKNQSSEADSLDVNHCGEASELLVNCPVGAGTSETDLPPDSYDEISDPTGGLRPAVDKTSFHMKEFLQIAYDDTYYRILCTVFDDRLKAKFHFVSGSYLEENKKGKLYIPNVLKRVLQYCHSKAFDSTNRAEQESLEKSLRNLKESVASLRAIRGLKSYEEMCWSYATLSCRTLNQT